MHQGEADKTIARLSPSASVLILTFNEQDCIGDCLDSVAWSNDIVVLDSLSTDRTVDIVKGHPAKVRLVQRPFDDFSSQRNYGLHELGFANAWVFLIDADEICTPELANEMLRSVETAAPGVSAFRLRRTTHFLGSFLNHDRCRSVWLNRLVRPREVRFQGLVHEAMTHSGVSRPLRQWLPHYPFKKGVRHWVERRNAYSCLAARSEFAAKMPMVTAQAWSPDPIQRRRWLNALYRRLPLRWLIFFSYNLIVKLCFLDGAKGMYMNLLETYYEILVIVKLRELEERSNA